MTDKLLNIESMPSIKLGFTQMGQDDVNHINKYIDDNVDRLPDLSSSLVGQIIQNEKSKQLEFDFMKDKIQGNHNTIYMDKDVYSRIMSKYLMYKNTQSLQFEELQDVDAIMPLINKVVHMPQTVSKEEFDKVSEFIKDWLDVA